MCPNYRTWKTVEEIPEKVHSLLQSDWFIPQIFPAAQMMLGNNIGNLQWTARVLIGMGIYATIFDMSGVLQFGYFTESA
jgi:hypothetical protein